MLRSVIRRALASFAILFAILPERRPAPIPRSTSPS